MTRTLMADNGELVEVDCDCAECAVLRGENAGIRRRASYYAQENEKLRLRVAKLEEALNSVKNLLSGGQYAIARYDGKDMGLGEQYIVGSIFERADKALGVLQEARDE